MSCVGWGDVKINSNVRFESYLRALDGFFVGFNVGLLVGLFDGEEVARNDNA